MFWKTHDPTTLNQQGNDFGPQYRSAIFYHNDEQRRLAEEYKKKLDAARIWDKPIVTEITPFTNFFRLKIITKIISTTIQSTLLFLHNSSES